MPTPHGTEAWGNKPLAQKSTAQWKAQLEPSQDKSRMDDEIGAMETCQHRDPWTSLTCPQACPGQGVEPELFFLPSYVFFSHVGQGSGQCLPGGQYLPAVPSRSQVKGREGRSSEVSGRTANGLHVRGYTGLQS